MAARAEAASRTTERIYTAAGELFRELPFPDVTVQAVADRAGVSLQTVLRKFGSKERLFEAASEAVMRRVISSREPARRDVRAAVEALVASYEEMGDLGWNALRQEDRFPWVKKAMDEARAAHRAWVERAFAHLVPPRPGAERERRILLLFAATDFYLWKLLRRDLGVGRAATIERMIDLVNGAASGGQP